MKKNHLFTILILSHHIWIRVCFYFQAHAANEVLLYENLEKLGANALSRDNETELGE